MNKLKVVNVIALVLNAVLLGVLVVGIINVSHKGNEAAGPDASQSGPDTSEPPQTIGSGADDGELEQWVDNMKFLAQKHNVNALFLQELFPEQIVYKHDGEIIYAEVDNGLAQHGFNWDNLQEDENGVLRYSEPGGLEGIFGIDVSKYQGNINWQKVKDAGVGYVIIRVGFRGYGNGEIKLDEYFESYIKGATGVGLPVGVYFFSQAVNTEEAVEEAEYVMEAVKGYELSYPIVFDMEEVAESPNRTEHLTAAEITDIAMAFCDRVHQEGYKSMIYGNVSWFLSLMELERIQNYDLWFAQYREKPWFPYDFKMWQYSHTGALDGIEGEVDMNICFVDYAAA